MIRHAFRALFLAILLVSTLARVAHAAPDDPPTPSDSVSLARMDLEYFAEQARAARILLGLSTLGVATVLVPTGVVLRTRPDNESHLVAGGLILGGATPLIPAISALFPSAVERLSLDAQARQTAGRPASETLRVIEDGWREAAEQNRRSRLYIGVAGLVLGSAALAAGLVFMLEPSGFGGLSETTQYTLGSAFIGAGVPISALGLRSLVVPSIEETSWEAYVRLKAGAPASAPPVSLPSVSVAPARGGGLAVLSATF
jgi:hypothetical protein